MFDLKSYFFTNPNLINDQFSNVNLETCPHDPLAARFNGAKFTMDSQNAIYLLYKKTDSRSWSKFEINRIAVVTFVQLNNGRDVTCYDRFLKRQRTHNLDAAHVFIDSMRFFLLFWILYEFGWRNLWIVIVNDWKLWKMICDSSDILLLCMKKISW